MSLKPEGGNTSVPGGLCHCGAPAQLLPPLAGPGRWAGKLCWGPGTHAPPASSPPPPFLSLGPPALEEVAQFSSAGVGR